MVVRVINGLCYSTILRENVTRLTTDCEELRNVLNLHAFSAIG
ncbi:hypothetical protein UYSO10_4413 [Kosakonia radicincitans]|nr:hypothetical protein UYSO10_4413 [Kosakonia radicincitans]